MKQSTIAILTGSKGSGKTFTQREIISLHPRIYALEPHGGEFKLSGAVVCGPCWTARDLDVVEENTSAEFRRACQEPMQHGQYRRLAFDTRTREQIEVSKDKLRELFRVPRFALPAKTSIVEVAEQKRRLWGLF